MIHKNTIFECTDCNAEFEILAHSDFEDTDVSYCPVCGAPVESDAEPEIDDWDED